MSFAAAVGHDAAAVGLFPEAVNANEWNDDGKYDATVVAEVR